MRGSTSVDSGQPPDGIDPSRRAVEAFAAELRNLRERAGSPSYRELARRTHYSASTLAEAVSGRRLPSEAVVRALVEAYGGDAEEWLSRLARANAEARQPPANEPAPDAAGPARREARTRRTSSRVPRWLVEAVGAVLIAAVALFIGAQSMDRPAASGRGPINRGSTTPAGVTYPATDGQDPKEAGCAADARLIDKATLARDGRQLGVLELKYSPLCAAGWARIYLNEGIPNTLGTVQVAAADGSAMSFTLWLRGTGPGGAIYTNVVTPHGGCLLASATLEPASPQRVTATTLCNPLASASPTGR